MEALTPRFRPGDRVRVRADEPKGHCRTPHYVRGKAGRVVRLQGVFPNPEGLAYGGQGLPRQPLYLVEFDQPSIWENYAGPSVDKVCVDIYQHWLAPA